MSDCLLGKDWVALSPLSVSSAHLKSALPGRLGNSSEEARLSPRGSDRLLDKELSFPPSPGPTEGPANSAAAAAAAWASLAKREIPLDWRLRDFACVRLAALAAATAAKGEDAQPERERLSPPGEEGCDRGLLMNKGDPGPAEGSPGPPRDDGDPENNVSPNSFGPLPPASGRSQESQRTRLMTTQACGSRAELPYHRGDGDRRWAQPTPCVTRLKPENTSVRARSSPISILTDPRD